VDFTTRSTFAVIGYLMRLQVFLAIVPGLLRHRPSFAMNGILAHFKIQNQAGV
jgi:hypothetical protein